MQQFLIKIGIFITIPLLTYVPFNLLLLPILLENVQGPSTEKQIDYSFENALKRDYEMLILGNSRLYRGLNPDHFSIDTYNFSHDNDTYNQIYYKLQYLYDNGKDIKFLILGVDYFQFSFLSDTRNYVYGSYFREDYLKDYEPKLYRLNHLKNSLRISRYRLFFRPFDTPFIRENGQYIRDGIAQKNNSGDRSAARKILQVQYFQRILKFCQKKDIEVFLVMPPIRTEALKLYETGEIAEWNLFLKNYIGKDVKFFDFSRDNSFELEDYTDLTHLNEEAANKFSKKLNDSIEYVLRKKLDHFPSNESF